MDEVDDPTCIISMLEEFRADARNYYRSSMLPLNALDKNTPNSTTLKSRRSKFGDFGSSNADIPDKRAKIETGQDVTNEVMSPWEIRRIKSEVMKSRTQIIDAEARIKKLEALNMELMLCHNNEINALEENLLQERAKVSELENRLSFIRKREAEAVERYSQLKINETDRESAACKMLSYVQKENLELKDNLYELQNEAETKKRLEETEIKELTTELDSLREKEKVNTELIEELRKDLAKRNSEVREMEIEHTKFLAATKRVKDLESEREAYLETRAYVESQNKKLIQYAELERNFAELKEENKRLKSSISNTLYLETVVEDLKGRQKNFDSLGQDLIRLRTENQNQKIELDNWNELSTHYCTNNEKGVKSFILVQRRLEELVKKELWYVSENKNLELRIKHLEEKIAELENELTTQKTQNTYLKTSCETHASTIRRIKKQLQLVSWERNDLRNLLDSCQKDMTISSDGHTQLDTLQKVIDGYKERLEQIETDPSIISVTGIDVKPSAVLIERDALLKREAGLKEENKKLHEKIQNLNDQIEHRYLKGDFDVRQTKILHFKGNPTAEATLNLEDRLSKANEEICRLRERVKVLEEGNDEDVTRIVEERVQTSSIKEITELKEKTSSLEIQNQRLCEVFRKRSRDFRDAVYMLFGYRVDVLPNNQYRLCSLYAYDAQEVLLFQISQASNGTMELLETSYSQTLSELIDLHLKQHKSIPLFLASLTVDLFNKQTMTSFSTTVEVSTCDN